MTSSARRVLHSLHDAARSQLWPIPTFGVIIAVALGILVPRLDATTDGRLPPWIDGVVFGGDAGAARTVLDAVSSSLITVTALTFSLTVVTLQLASSQFSPRLLRTFSKDLFVQVTLAIFLATFTFSLTVLRSVRSTAESSAPFVPRIAVTVSFLLAITSVICLVLFLAHLTRQIRVETMLANVHTDAIATARSNLLRWDARAAVAFPATPTRCDQVRARRSGFLLRVDEDEVVRAASQAGCLIRVERCPGDFVVAGTPVASVWRRDGESLTGTGEDELREALHGALHVGKERTGAQDTMYGLRQLVDVANKALSPGINDPTTAVHALGHISALVSELAQFRLGPVIRADADGTIRAQFARAGFADYLELAVTQPRRYGGSDPQVTVRLLELLGDLAHTVPTVDLDAVEAQLRRLDRTRGAHDFDLTERNVHDRLASEIRGTVAGRYRGDLTRPPLG